jgi:hypothetical protein
MNLKVLIDVLDLDLSLICLIDFCHGFRNPYGDLEFGFKSRKFDELCHVFGNFSGEFEFVFKSHKFNEPCHGFGSPYGDSDSDSSFTNLVVFHLMVASSASSASSALVVLRHITANVVKSQEVVWML